MCWVMPPASFAVTFVSRMASRRDVFPWSTWPMTQITGGLGTMSFSSSSSSFKSSSMTLIFFSFSQSTSYSMAISSAFSKSISWLMVTMVPCKNSFFTMADGWSFILSASSLMVMTSGITMVLISSTFSTFFGCGGITGAFTFFPPFPPLPLVISSSWSFLESCSFL